MKLTTAKTGISAMNRRATYAILLAVTALAAVHPAPANPVAAVGEAVVAQHAVAGASDETLRKAIELIQQGNSTAGKSWQAPGPARIRDLDRTLILGGPEAFPM